MHKAVIHYNTKRPHNNLGKLTPIDFENKWLKNQQEVNNVLTIFDNEKLIKNGQH